MGRSHRIQQSGHDEAYRARLRTDAEARENFASAQAKRFVLREERTFCVPAEVVGRGGAM